MNDLPLETDAPTDAPPPILPKTPRKDRSASVGYKRAGREMALQFLYQFDLGGARLDQRELDLFWRGIESDDEEEEEEEDPLDANYRRAKKYANAVIAGVVDRQEELDALIGQFSIKWDLKRISAIDRNILRVAIFEMLDRMEIPPVVSINEAIEISKDFSTEKSANFINGVLNSVKNTLDRPAREGAVKSMNTDQDERLEQTTKDA